MKKLLIILLLLVSAQVCLSGIEEEMEAYAKKVAHYAYVTEGLESAIYSLSCSDVSRIDSCMNLIKQRNYDVYSSEYVVGARYDSIYIPNKSEIYRVFFIYLSCIKHDTTQIRRFSAPDRYCIVTSAGKYYLLDTKRQFENIKEVLEPIDSRQKAEFLAIIYSKCIKGISHYEVNNPNCSISTVFRKNEFITTISEKKYDSYWNDLVKKEVVFTININGEYSLVNNTPEKE